MSKVQFNVRLDEDVAEWIATEALLQTANLGAKVSQADVVAILVRRAMEQPEAVPTKKLSKKEQAQRERASTDVTAKAVEREDIDYSDVESTPTSHIANSPLPAKGSSSRLSIADWRAGRKPLLKPKEQ